MKRGRFGDLSTLNHRNRLFQRSKMLQQHTNITAYNTLNATMPRVLEPLKIPSLAVYHPLAPGGPAPDFAQMQLYSQQPAITKLREPPFPVLYP